MLEVGTTFIVSDEQTRRFLSQGYLRLTPGPLPKWDDVAPHYTVRVNYVGRKNARLVFEDGPFAGFIVGGVKTLTIEEVKALERKSRV